MGSVGAASAIKVLLVEDDPGDARLVQLLIEEQIPSQFHFLWVQSLQDAITHLADHRFDVALLDLSLPDSFGLDTLVRLRCHAPMLPIVVLTGNADNQTALQAVQQGAQDYLIKGQGDGDLIRRSIRYAIERFQVDANLRRSEAQLRAIFENAAMGIGLLDRGGRLSSANPALVAMLGVDPAQNGRVSLTDFIHPDDRPQVLEKAGDLLEGRGDRLLLEARFEPKSGGFSWGRLAMSAVNGPDGHPQFAVALVEDISARKSMEDQLRLSAQVIEATSEGVFVTDANRAIIHVNPSFTHLTGYTPEDVLGHQPSVLSSGRHDKVFYDALWESLNSNDYWRGEIWNRKKSGEIFAEWINISAIRDDEGRIKNYVAVFSDITLRKQSEEKLSHQAHHDPLTGLPNRALFTERLDRALARARRNDLVVAVLFLDLDHFKQINDSLGHLAGDSLLQQVADRLQTSVRNEDTVARMGGDEFTLILEDIADFRDAATVAQKILQQFSLPFILACRPTHVTTSIGISLYPADGDTAADLVHLADEAMYSAKKQGRDSFRFASPDLSERAFERQVLENELRRAIEDGKLELHYQPIIELAGNTVTGAEALLRWRHPDIGLMVPGQFLPLARESGLIVPLGRWMMKTAFAQTALWRAQGFDLRLCINVSKTELQHPDFVLALKENLERAGLPASSLDIEIPETVAMEADPAVSKVIERLRQLGARVALDDFGLGRTDFRQLRNSPVDALKIAPEFLRDVGADHDEAKLVRTTTAIAHSMNMRVYAKAVETSDQHQFLRLHRCDGAQGYFFSRPLPAEEFSELLGAPLPMDE